MNVNLSITIKQNTFAPRDGVFYVVKNDYDMTWLDFGNVKQASRPTRNGVPYIRDDPRAKSNRALPATARSDAIDGDPAPGHHPSLLEPGVDRSHEPSAPHGRQAGVAVVVLDDLRPAHHA